MSIEKSISKYINLKGPRPVPFDEKNQDYKFYFRDGTHSMDITDRHSLISLNPFAIAVNAKSIADANNKNSFLVIEEQNKWLAELSLHLADSKVFKHITFLIYHASIPSKTIPVPYKIWISILLTIKNKTDKKSKKFIVPPAELMKLFVYTIKPHPVYLVTIEHEDGFDAFPIDIFGFVDKAIVLLSIRTSSPAIERIRKVKRICASLIPFEKRSAVYKLGRHHPDAILKKEDTDISFEPSREFSVPVPQFAVFVYELQADDFFTTGVHTQIIASLINSYSKSDDLQLAHTPWFNKKYFQR